MSNNVLAIVTNYNSPDAAGQVVRALVDQPCDIVVVDNSPPVHRFNESLHIEHQRVVADIWQWSVNSGPQCRFAPATMLATKYKYILFQDDDAIPGQHAVENLLEVAESLGDDFATIGQIGRRYRFRNGQWSYRKNNVHRTDKPEPVDLTCRSHFCLSEMATVALFHWYWVARKIPDTTEDDMMLCHGAQQELIRPSYLIPSCPPDHAMIRKTIKKRGIHTQSARVDHLARRTAMIRASVSIGWKRQDWK